jgi:hypothetical protein
VQGGKEADRVACRLSICSGYPTRTEIGLAISDHPIERRNGDGDFSLLSCEGTGTQARTDGLFVAADRGLDEATTAVTGCLLPNHPALLRNRADVAVALTRSVAG